MITFSGLSRHSMSNPAGISTFDTRWNYEAYGTSDFTAIIHTEI